MGADALRYFLLREIVFGQDGSFSYDALISRYNSDLANGLGNLASRTLTMINQYRGGEIPAGARSGDRGAGQPDHSDGAGDLRPLRILQGPGSGVGADLARWTSTSCRTRRGSWRRQTDEASQAGVQRHALHRRRSAAHRHRAARPGAAAIGAQDLGAARHDRTRSRTCGSTRSNGAAPSRARRSAKSPPSSRASK